MTRTIRISQEVAEVALAYAGTKGVSLSFLVEAALASYLGLSERRAFEVLEAICEYLMERYPDRRGFDEKVTLEVFHWLRDDPRAERLYVAATTDDEGRPDSTARASLHRKIGRLVKTVLQAQVIRRSGPLDPKEHLVRSFTLLEPADPSEGASQ